MADKKPVKKKYEVVGDRAVYGNDPGTTFEADLSAFDENRLIEGGHIQPAK